MHLRPPLARRLLSILLPLLVVAAIPPLTFLNHAEPLLDRYVTAWVHSLTTEHLTTAMKFMSRIAYDNLHFWIIAMVAVYGLLRRRSMAAPLALLAARYGAEWLANLLKEFYARPRPVLEWVTRQSSGYSYPSTSVAVGAAFYVMLACTLSAGIPNRRLKVAVQASGWAVAAVIALSRIYLGAHWLTDTLAGLCVAASLTAALSFAITFPVPWQKLLASLHPVPAAAGEMGRAGQDGPARTKDERGRD